MKFTKQKLGNLLTVKRGATLPGTGYSDKGRYLRLTLANIKEEGGFKEFKSTQGKFFVGKFDQRFIMHKGDLITPLTEQTPGLLGSVAFIPCDDLYIQSQDIGLVNCNTERIDKRFAYYLFLTHPVRKQISARSQQTKIRHTSPDKIADVKVYIPDLPDQLLIAGILGSLDEKIEVNRRKIAELEALARTIYDFWFLQFDFPDANGRPYKSSGGAMEWKEELKREIPRGWEVSCLGKILSVCNGKDHKYLADGKYPVVGSGGIMRYAAEYLYDGESVLIPRKGTLNNIMFMQSPFWTVDTMFYTRPKRANIMKYVYMTVRNFDFERLNTGTGVPSMTASIINRILIIIPPERLVNRINEILGDVFCRIEKLKEESAALVQARDFLLALLMNGQVEVAG